MKKETEKIIIDATEELLEMLSIEGNVSVVEAEDKLEVSIDTEDSSLLIGYHGENLESFQLMLSFLVSKKLGEFQRLVVNVGDYRQRREEKLKEIAMRAKQEVLEKGEEVALPPTLSSNERRIIHLFLQTDEEVSSESVGEGQSRQLIVRPKKQSA